MPRFRALPGCRCGGTGTDGCPRDTSADEEPVDPALAQAFDHDADIGSPLLRSWLSSGLALAIAPVESSLLTETPRPLAELTAGSLNLLPTITAQTTEEPDA